MKIDWDQSACGLSLLEIRNLLRSAQHWGRITSVNSIVRRLEPKHSDYSLSYREIESARKTRVFQSGQLLATFAASGLIECPKGEGMAFGSKDYHPGYDLTPAAFGLMRATKTKRITRKAADAAVEKLCQAIAQINSDPVLMYKVDRICIYGSYLTDSPDLGDVDVAFSLARRWSNKDEYEKMRDAFERVHAPPQNQQYVHDYQYDWNEKVVKRMLRPKACIQLTDMYHAENLGCPMLEIYPDEQAIPAKPDYVFDRSEIRLIEDDGSALSNLEEQIRQAVEDRESKREAERQAALANPDDPAHEITKRLSEL